MTLCRPDFVNFVYKIPVSLVTSIDVSCGRVREKQTKKGCHAFMAPFRLFEQVSRLPAIALSTGTTTTTATESTAAATGTLLHRFRFVDR